MTKKKSDSAPSSAQRWNTPVSTGLLATVLLPIAVPLLIVGVDAFAEATRKVFDPAGWKGIEELIGNTLLGPMLGSIGVAMFVGLVAYWRQSRAAEFNTFPAGEPWQARCAWAAGRIPGDSPRIVSPMLGWSALWWLVATVPLLMAAPHVPIEPSSAPSWLIALLPVPGLLLGAIWLPQYLRALKFSEPVFEMDGVPGMIGGYLAGVVRIPGKVESPEGFRVKLTCLESRRGGERACRELTVWQNEQVIANAIDSERSNETCLPVELEIPYKAPPSSTTSGERNIAWRMETWATTPGTDYTAQFAVPVFRTPETRREIEPEHVQSAAGESPRNRDAVLRKAGIVKEKLASEGVRLTFPAARRWRSAVPITLFPVVVSIIALAALQYDEVAWEFFNLEALWGEGVFQEFGTPEFFKAVYRAILAVVSAVAALVVTIGFTIISLDLWLFRSVVEATRAGLSYRGGWLGIGKRRSISAADIRQFKPTEFLPDLRGSVWQAISVVPRRGKGKILAIAKGLSNKLAAQVVFDELNVALGRC